MVYSVKAFNESEIDQKALVLWNKNISPLYVPVTVHREQSVKKEYQQDATI